MLRRRTIGSKKLVFFQKRFYPAGNYTWVVPKGCTEVDVFLVGGGGGASDVFGGGGGYTKTFKKDTTGWRDGDAISVTPSQIIPIIVGKGGKAGAASLDSPNVNAGDGGHSQFMNSAYRAEGGQGGKWKSLKGGDGGSGGGASGKAGSDGSDGTSNAGYTIGKGQGHTTRDFGEPTGKRNAGGGGSNQGGYPQGGVSDYTEGKGGNSVGNGVWAYGGGGYGGGAGGAGNTWQSGYQSPGGDGTVLIRYWAYEE